ncbi:MAG: HD-like signal output (HDOD) protein [Porticoccus sp.]|jgi:HD-like signal output (HDOD) protein
MDDLEKFNALGGDPTSDQELMIKEHGIFGHTSATITIALLISWSIPEPIYQAIT